MNAAAPVIALDHPAAFDVARVGRKAAALARARAVGLPVGSGVVLTTQWCREDRATALQVWRILSHDGALALTVRSSAVTSDRRHPADAGAIERTRLANDAAQLLHAIDAIRDGGDRTDSNVPVLVQPHVVGAWRGLLFSDDAVSARRRRHVVVATDDTDQWIAHLDEVGRVRDVLSGEHLDHPPVEVLARLVRLADRVAAAFDRPHDIEWATDDAGRVHLLRIRPGLRSTETGTTVRCERRRAQVSHDQREPAA